MNINPLTLLDFYKIDHISQYPEGVSKIVSNMTPRKSRIPNVDYVVWFGLQYYIKEFLMKQWDKLFIDPEYYIGKYEDTVRQGVNPKYKANFLRDLAKLKYLPLAIRSLPEGSKVPMRVPCMTIENTHPDFAWLPNFLETQISAELWQISTSATIAHVYAEVFRKYAKETGDESLCRWQGHDFSMRGMSSVEAAAKSGAAHLLSFWGTDTVCAFDWIKQYYSTNTFIGGSVPATEHSVMCSGGQNTELDTYRRLINIYPEGIVSIVSDTWDFWSVITNILPVLKNEIMARNGKVVIRPDSGDPVDILCGDKNSGISHINKGLIECLWDLFGGTINSKGYKVLDPHIGAIYGDSITLDRQKEILEKLARKGFASSNIVLGIGSFTYQHTTRDTFGWAIKATYQELNGQPQALFKAPKTDDGTKFSTIGLPFVTSSFELIQNVDAQRFNSIDNALSLVYMNGNLLNDYKFEDIRKRVGML